jgi:KaiC/GvpD/RAD55 family RecA-like ATPase
MNSTQDNKTGLPYSDLGKVLLECIFDGLTVCIDKPEINSSDEGLRNCFKKFFNHKDNARGVNPHFSLGNTKKDFYETRVTKIVIQSYREIQEDFSSSKGFALPSPLYILSQILTIPDEPQSAAYSLLFCRSFLFEVFKVFPVHPLLPKNFESFNITHIKNYLDTFNSYTVQFNNIPIADTVPAQQMLINYLAMRGVFYLRFGETQVQKKKTSALPKARQIEVAKENSKKNAEIFLAAKKINAGSESKEILTFHKLSYYEQLPEAASLMNELCGVPIPIRGAETIFQGGLKTDSNSNLVIRISGEPGSGKTSLALALCASLAPFGTFSFYMSLEEHPKDLQNRLYSLIPNYIKKLSIYKSDVDNWFLADKIMIGHKNRLDYFETEYIDNIYERLNKKVKDKLSESLPAVCPLIIVIDSIRVLLNEENSNLERFIEKCKKLNAIFLLISSNDEKFHNEIDYLVDLVIHLKHSGTENQADKPVRIFQLTKTRHQISRPGSHIFHLSGEKSFRISPQLPSQIDRKEKMLRPTPSNQFFIDFFNAYQTKNGKREEKKLKVWEKSQILIHGYGSSGKAGLSMNILLSPIQIDQSEGKMEYNVEQHRRKVLVISLLYPEEYYKGLRRSISSQLQKNSSGKILEGKVECIYFYSGFLTPEDFISKILRKLDKAILEGEPFTGILLDGLHNVSLQFRKLQESDMLWPTLYSLLSKYRLTIVTTFTNFVIDNETKQGSMDDNEILLQGHKPLLHALVQASDYHFTVQPPEKSDLLKYEGKYIIALKSAIRHKMRGEKFVWDREKQALTEYVPRLVQQKLFDSEK